MEWEGGWLYLKMDQISFREIEDESERMGKALRGDRTHQNSLFSPYNE